MSAAQATDAIISKLPNLFKVWLPHWIENLLPFDNLPFLSDVITSNGNIRAKADNLTPANVKAKLDDFLAVSPKKIGLRLFVTDPRSSSLPITILHLAIKNASVRKQTKSVGFFFFFFCRQLIKVFSRVWIRCPSKRFYTESLDLLTRPRSRSEWVSTPCK